MKTPETLLDVLLDAFGHSPTGHQYKAFHGLARFLLTDKPKPTFLLNGAAGTGKTTMLRAVVKVCTQLERPIVLMAPTGRAAKVLARKVGREASTIHRWIYQSSTDAGGGLRFRRRPNDDPPGTVYIVDEASMIGERDETSGRSLLADLVDFVFPPTTRHQLILVGDTAQLPPVGAVLSPALDAGRLRRDYGLTAGTVTMTQVKRQALESGILYNATRLRAELDRPDADPSQPPQLRAAEDVVELPDAEALLDTFLDHYDRDAPDRVVVLTYSNSMAVQINQAIRNRLYHEPGPLEPGDSVMVVKNWYQALTEALPFVANGDAGTIEAVHHKTEEDRYGQTWCDVTLALQDLASEAVSITAKVPIQLPGRTEPALPRPANEQIYQERRLDFQREAEEKAQRTGRKVQRFDPKADPYINCLQLKYGYAITGHKAQGGQWQHVIVAFEPALARLQAESWHAYLRWVYTAFTRASERLYLFRNPFDLREQPDDAWQAKLADDGLDTFRS